ncbi:MAG: IclR family transcriptional regulator [Advenella sp.]
MNKLILPGTMTRDGSQSLRRAIHLLRTMSMHTSTGWRLTDLAYQTDLDHTTVHRLLKSLVDEGLATRVPGSKRYTLGSLAYEIGLAATPYFSIEAKLGDSLSKLAESTQEMIFLNIRSGCDTVCVARHKGAKALMAYTVDVGTRRPLCLSAGGVAILINLPRKQQMKIEAENLRAIERNGQARAAAVKQILSQSRALGFGLNQENIIPGIAAIGVPIRSKSNEPIAALSLASDNLARLNERRDKLLARLYQEAEKIERVLDQLRF